MPGLPGMIIICVDLINTKGMKRINIQKFTENYGGLRFTRTNLIVILDIDESLAHTFTDTIMDELKIPHGLQAYMLNILMDRNNGGSATMWGVKRPYLDTFLNFCFSYFKLLIVWSAGTYEYVHTIVQ